MGQGVDRADMPRFGKVISLGPSCETAYQIRQIVVQEEAYVFDWVIASAKSVARALGNNFVEFIEPHGLSLRHAANLYVEDSLTGIEFHHDFTNTDAFLDSLPNVRSKYAYLIDRTRTLLASRTPVLFVHQLGTRDDATLLAGVIARRWPTLEFRLLELAIGGSPVSMAEDRVAYRWIPGHGSNWQERTPLWATVLDELLDGSYGHTLERRDPATRETL